MSLQHGTYRAYIDDGCRCTACREANRVTCAAWRARQGEPLRHDASTYSNYRCRCATCRAAHAAKMRLRYQGTS